MADAYETDLYEDAPNFNHRFKVETNMGRKGVVDHREGFAQQEYRKNMQDNPSKDDKLAGFPPMKSATKPPKAKGGVKQVKTKTDDAALEAAKTLDLKNRNLKQ